MINAKNIRFSYPRQRSLFESLNLDLPKGSITGLLGRNGEGKTTLLKLLCGQLLRKDGNLTVLTEDPRHRSVKFLSKVFLLQEEVTCPNVTIRDYFRMITPFYPSYSPEVAQEIIIAFDLNWDMKLGKVSQGQKKKAVIALALSLRTPLLLMDEPTNGLDIPSKSAFRRLMARYITEEQTVIISTHQVRDLEQIIDRIVMMDKNAIVCNRSVAELSEQFAFRQVVPGDKPIYKEGSTMGEVGVYENTTEEETPFSMELFFNGMIAEREVFNRVLNR
ncbi:ABC transporter ATP-binding protein [Porphyromonas gingivalis]|uniref:ATP-binding cassette domain-containing protein n=1 Tax=Porphyromonas gingivalis TaxID=837 RepID=UPI001F1FB685|nr:ABC transporter ATP-binding protein [Porphyromonas gingivalis]MCE8188969.1 ABC transporter ATP-binding protein [Porphyromonas gingivalis]